MGTLKTQNNKIIITSHFRDRFRKRVANSKRIDQFVENAAKVGKTVGEINDANLAYNLLSKQKEYGSCARLYNNYIYWFNGNCAITVYQVSQNNHTRRKK